MLNTIASFLGTLFAALLPALVDEWNKADTYKVLELDEHDATRLDTAKRLIMEQRNA